MPTYQLGIGMSDFELRMKGFNTFEAEEEVTRLTRRFSEDLRILGYKSSTSGNRLYDGYDGLIISDRMFGLDAMHALAKLKAEYVVPIFIGMIGPKLLELKRK